MFPILAGITLSGLYFIIKWLEDPALLNKILGYYFSTLGVVGVGKLLADALNVATSILAPSIRAQITKSALFKCYIHMVISAKTKIQYQTMIGMVFGVIAISAYNFLAKPWWLTNLIGWGFCYGTLQLMSPTTFWTGSLVLAGLFIYDITMVFYTPLMVTVATSLDVPIKLVFPGPGRGSMLGLGDVVLPGIMMALALRFDLYLHYLRKSALTLPSSPSPAVLTKAPYIEATGSWGDIFWRRTPSSLDGSRFNKTYFYASVIGYIIGMFTTLVILQIFNHAQPALLYLVPGVLIALWGTALVKGDLAIMWGYTEDGSLGNEEKQDDKVTNTQAEGENRTDAPAAEVSLPKEEDNSQYFFHISLARPRHRTAVEAAVEAAAAAI
jgi:minor histocompatibility antigen H13